MLGLLTFLLSLECWSTCPVFKINSFICIWSDWNYHTIQKGGFRPNFIQPRFHFLSFFANLIVFCIVTIGIWKVGGSPPKWNVWRFNHIVYGLDWLLFSWIGFVFAGLLGLVAVIVFGSLSGSRLWAPEWTFNYLSWAFTVAVVGVVLLHIAGILFLFEASVQWRRKEKRMAQRGSYVMSSISGGGGGNYPRKAWQLAAGSGPQEAHTSQVFSSEEMPRPVRPSHLNVKTDESKQTAGTAPDSRNLSPEASAPTDNLLTQQLSSLLAPSPFEEEDSKDLGYLSRSYSPGSDGKYKDGSPSSFHKSPSNSPPEDKQVLSSRLFDGFSTKRKSSPPESPKSRSPTAEVALLPKQTSYENTPTLPKSSVRNSTVPERPAIARFPYLVRTYDLPKRFGFSTEDYEESKTISLSPSPPAKKQMDSPTEDDQPLSAERLREASKQLFGQGVTTVTPPRRTPTPLGGMEFVPIPDKPLEDDKPATDAEAVSKLLVSRHPRSVKVIHIQKRKTESYDYKQSKTIGGFTPPEREESGLRESSF